MGGGTLNREVEKPKTLKGRNALLRAEAAEMAIRMKDHWEALNRNQGGESALSRACLKSCDLLVRMGEALKPCLVLALLLMLAACGGSPIAPARVRSRSTVTFDSTQLGHATVISTDPSEVYTLIVWLATDETNQVYQAQNSGSAPVGQVVDLTVGLTVDPCAKYQRDVYIGLPKQDRYTLSDVGNYFLAAPGKFWGPEKSCNIPPVNPPIVTPPPIVQPPPVGFPPPPGPPPCQGGATFTFPVRDYLAYFPPGYPDPWLPDHLGPFDFSIPAGTWHFTALSGDNHTEKGPLEDPDDHQKDEDGLIPLDAGATTIATLGPTKDVPHDSDVVFSDLGTVTLTASVTSIRILHAAPAQAEPNDSWYPISLTYACPSVSVQRKGNR